MSPREMTWETAIKKVLTEAGTALHYSVIAERIVLQGLRKKFGHTPSNTVYAELAGKTDVFEKVAPATFRLRGVGLNDGDDGVSEDVSKRDPPNPIMALGMFWERDLVSWTSKPAILGSQQPGAEPVNMAGQTGIYLLHDFRDVVYVGRAVEPTLGSRLMTHTRDRHKTRWNRFSWFGFRKPGERGALGPVAKTYDLKAVVVAMEALLIEALEPPQNRKVGDGFKGIEYIQAEDPEKTGDRLLSELEHLVRRRHRR